MRTLRQLAQDLDAEAAAMEEICSRSPGPCFCGSASGLSSAATKIRDLLAEQHETMRLRAAEWRGEAASATEQGAGSYAGQIRTAEVECAEVSLLLLGPPDPDFEPGERVIYIPFHANGDRGHPDCQRGTVTSVNEKYVFVRYGDGDTSAATKREDLRR